MAGDESPAPLHAVENRNLLSEHKDSTSRSASLRSLGHQLIERGGPKTLETDLIELRASLSDVLVGNLLAELSERTRASTLGKLLDHPKAAASAPSPGGVLWSRLEQGLLDWADELRARSGDARGTAPAAGVPEPPQDLVELELWAATHGVSHCLDLPTTRLVPWLDSANDRYLVRAVPEAKVKHCLERGWGQGAYKRFHGSRTLAKAARSYLWYKAGRRQIEASRRRLWSRPLSDPVLRTFSGKLLSLLKRLNGTSGADVPVVFDEAPLDVRTSPPALVVRFKAGGKQAGQVIETRLSLVGLDHEALALRCSCVGDGEPTCSHVRVLVEWTLDALHAPRDPLHRELTRVAAVPSWARLVKDLHADLEARESEDEPSRELVWRLGGQGRDIEVRPVVRSRLKNGGWGRGRKVTTRWLLDEDQILEPRDRKVLSALILAEEQGGTLGRSRLLANALENLVGHPAVYSIASPSKRIDVRRHPPTIVLQTNANEGILALQLGARLVPGGEVALHALGDRHLVLLDDETLECVVSPLSTRTGALLGTLFRQRAPLPPESHVPLLEVLSRAQPEVDLDVPEELRGEVREASKELVLRLDPLRGGGIRGALLVYPLKGGAAWPPGSGPFRVLGQEDGGLVCAIRDHEAENRIAESLVERLGLEEAPLDTPFAWRLEDQGDALDLLVAARELEDELPLEWPEGGRGAWRVRGASLRDLRVHVGRLHDWFGVEGEVEVEGETIPLSSLLEAVRTGQRYVRVAPGRFARLEASLRARLEEADEILFSPGAQRQSDPDSEPGLAVSRALASQLSEVFSESLDGDRAFLELRARMRGAADFEPELPDGFVGSLRRYQKEGYQWLARLAYWQVGACLADEMGLGKTIQTLAVLLGRASLGPALVVAPTSVGPGWVHETQSFAPSLRPLLYRGPKRRAMLSDLTEGDVLITSYDLLALDIGFLADIEFSSFVLDEAQAVKNPRTRRARAGLRVKAPFRVALTGTPLENHLGELWSIFHSINPGLLGSWDDFQRRFALPIERDGDMEARDRLAARLRPFLLRRTKAEVAPELPPRTEVIEPIELSPAERQLYVAVRREILERLAANGDGKAGKGRFVVLAGITKLRRVACHPRLLDPDATVPSSKLSTVLDLIDQLEERGERALIFSQFTSHLALLRQALEFREVSYLYLDGKTPTTRRARLVERWAEGTPGLFLISLKAGGTGLNLMGADYVVHLDPWWNPAVEDQAADRTHRIGQTRPVTVIRLIAQGTIEEAVLDLHARKRDLARGLLEGADTAGRLSSEELLDLVRWGDEGDETSEIGVTKPVDVVAKEPSEEESSPRTDEAPTPTEPEVPERPLPEHLRDVVSRFRVSLEEDRQDGVIKTDATVALYTRALKRFLVFAREDSDTNEEVAADLSQLTSRYLEALEKGLFPAPASEPAIARTVLKRLERFSEG